MDSKLNDIIHGALEANTDVFTLDETANAIEQALIGASGGPDHVISITGGIVGWSWTIQHPLAERFEGSLLDCPYTHFGAVTAQTIQEAEGNGRFRVWRDRGAIQWERVPEESL